MSDATKKPTSKFRTFADDLENQRHERDEGKASKKGPEPVKKVTFEPVPHINANPLDKPDKVVPKLTHIVAPTPKSASEPVPKLIIKPVPEPEKEKPEVMIPTEIPAFHEPHNKIDYPKKELEEKITVLAEKEKPKHQKINVGFDTEIITDTKNNKQNLFSVVFSSFKLWLKKVTTSKKKKIPTYSIPETSSRKGVIQKATTKNGSIFTADNETLKEQIRRRQLEEREQKELEENSETIWTPNTETGFGLLNEQNNISAVEVEYKRKVVSIPEEELVLQRVVEPISTPEEEQRWSNDVEPKEVPPPPPPPPKMIKTEPRLVPVVVPVETKKNSKLVRVENEPVERDTSEKRTGKHPVISSLDTNSTAILTLLGLVVIVAIIVTASTFIRTFNNEVTPSSPNDNLVETKLLNSNLVTIVINLDNQNSLARLINQQAQAVSGQVTEMAIINPVGELVDPSLIFQTLPLGAPPTLRQSLTSIRFISINQSKPALLLKFNDSTTVRGSLLQWENSMASNFSDLYDLSAGQAEDFVDDRVLGFDVRILMQNDEVVLLYSVLNEDTAIITTSKSNFSSMIDSGIKK